jgi:hypothetical protein
MQAPTPPPRSLFYLMKTTQGLRRYLVPAVFAAALVASFAFGYIANFVFSDPASERAGSAQGNAAQNGGNGNGGGSAGGRGPSALASGSRIGGQFSDAGVAVSGQTINDVTGGASLEDWLKKVMAEDDEAFRLRNFMRLFDTLNSPDDLKAALKALSEAGGGSRGAGRLEASLLLQKLTMLDPKAALAYAAEAKGGERMLATGTIMRTWAKTDPDAALAWIKENAKPKEGQDGAAGGGRRGQGGPGGAGGAENFLLAGVLTQIAKTNVDKALSAASTSEGRLGGRTTEVLAGEMIEQRGAEAARLAAAALPAGAFKDEFIQQLTGKLAEKDPQGTAAWANSLAAGDTKSRALREAVEEWTKKDATAAGAFVATLPKTADSDLARARYAAEVVGKDQTSALATVNAMADPERQKRTVSEIAGSMARKDVAASQQFIAQTSLNAQTKADITKAITQPARRGPGGMGAGPGGAAGGAPGGGRGMGGGRGGR